MYAELKKHRGVQIRKDVDSISETVYRAEKNESGQRLLEIFKFVELRPL